MRRWLVGGWQRCRRFGAQALEIQRRDLTAVGSSDGKTRTVTAKGKNVLGQAVDNVNVYDKQ